MQVHMAFLFSYIAIWFLVALLCAAMILLYRYFRHYIRFREEELDAAGPIVDSQINMTLRTSDGGTCRFVGSAHPHVIFFMAPNRPECELAERILKRAITLPSSVTFVLVCEANTDSTNRYVKESFPSVTAIADPSRELARLWNVKSIPYFVVSDSNGIIRAKDHRTTKRALGTLVGLANRLSREAVTDTVDSAAL